MSRCTIPASWAAAGALAVWMQASTISVELEERGAARSRSVVPSTSSVTISGWSRRARRRRRWDVRVVEGGGGFGFEDESFDALGHRVDDLGKDLDGDGAPEQRIVGEVDFAYSSPRRSWLGRDTDRTGNRGANGTASLVGPVMPRPLAEQGSGERRDVKGNAVRSLRLYESWRLCENQT
ncbi:MAG: hypothetical protein IPF53_20980 [Blastocatellia bacterium]|nr:hypothetical protein [Blastocatellia bacterium]